MKEQIKQFVEKNSWFNLDSEEENELSFATRNNGDGYHCLPGSRDILERDRMAKALLEHFPKDSIAVRRDTCDEWTTFDVIIL